jgi:hypothetical protein
LRIVPTTSATGVDRGITFTLMSESGGNFPGAWAEVTDATPSNRPVINLIVDSVQGSEK